MDEFDHLGPGFFFGFEFEAGAAEDFFRRFRDHLGSYSDDEFERTYHDFTHREKTRSRDKTREGRGGNLNAEPSVPRRNADPNAADPDEKKSAFFSRERPRGPADDARATFSAPSESSGRANARVSKKGSASHHASNAARTGTASSAFAKKKNAAPLSSRETAFAAVAAAEAAERAAKAAEEEKKRARRLAAMTPGERAAEAAREEAEAAAARAEAAEQKKRADAKREKKRLAAARAAERERQERARAEERARELAEMYRAQFAAETAERDAQASFSEPPPSREQARAARAAAFSAAAAKEDARAAAALKAAKSADSVSQKAALEEDSRAAERISAALAAANEAARQSRFAKWDALWDASPGTPPSASAAKPGESSETARASISTLETPVPPPEISAAPRAAPPEAPRALREKKIPCRYFCSGQACRFGDACRFAHDGAAASEAAPSETPVPTAARSAQALRESKVAAYKAASHAQRRAKAYKTKPCRHWTQKGTCARGEACGFIHEDAPAHPGGVGFAPRAKAYKTKPCRYWTQKGTCARGEACGFIHEDAPEHPGGVEPATRTGRFASHSATYCSVCRLSFGAEHELVKHLWSDGHRDRINDAFDFADDAA